MIRDAEPASGYRYHVQLWMVVSIFAGIQGYLLLTLVENGLIESSLVVSFLKWSLLAIMATAVYNGVKPAIKDYWKTGDPA